MWQLSTICGLVTLFSHLIADFFKQTRVVNLPTLSEEIGLIFAFFKSENGVTTSDFMISFFSIIIQY